MVSGDAPASPLYIAAWAAGMASSFLFSAVYIPQILLNYQRKSTSGLSVTSMLIKLVGGGFLFVNAFLLGEPAPVWMYGFLGFFQYSVLLFQMGLYSNRPLLKVICLPFLIGPLLLGTFLPSTMALTNTIKPFTQIASHVTQLAVCVQNKSTKGVSLNSQHFNFIGAVLGVFMCFVIPPKANTTWFLYINSLFQASSFYGVALFYGGVRFFLLESTLTAWLVRGGLSHHDK